MEGYSPSAGSGDLMLSLTANLRIFFHRQPTDMRLGYEGLRNKVTSAFGENPLSGNLFVFFNKGNNRCKILFYDKGGLCLFCKRLELGTFAIPRFEDNKFRHEIDRVELAMFLDGIVAKELRHKKRFSP